MGFYGCTALHLKSPAILNFDFPIWDPRPRSMDRPRSASLECPRQKAGSSPQIRLDPWWLQIIWTHFWPLPFYRMSLSLSLVLEPKMVRSAGQNRRISTSTEWTTSGSPFTVANFQESPPFLDSSSPTLWPPPSRTLSRTLKKHGKIYQAAFWIKGSFADSHIHWLKTASLRNWTAFINNREIISQGNRWRAQHIPGQRGHKVREGSHQK